MFKLLLASALLALAAGECPNACSGHGTCGQYDLCTCFDRWTNNDCSERVCPFGLSFVTTPQGDLNMDGDRYDNTQKLIVKQVGGAANLGSITENDNILTLATTVANTLDVTAGDAIRVGDEVFEVTSVSTADGKLITLDHDRFTTIIDQPVYRFLETITSPKGTWEAWAGDYNSDDEGHYYMECSNRGLCDRKEGTCACFDGYDGSACQRQACPNDCSGHGTCEKISELAKSNSTILDSYVVDAATAGSNSITLSHNPAYSSTSDTLGSYHTLAVGDQIRLGSRNAELLTVETITSTATTATITTSTACTDTHMYGTRIYHVSKYDLWDADKDRACKCDYTYTGNDCSQRDCPHGDDPLTQYEAITSGWRKGEHFAKSTVAGGETTAFSTAAAATTAVTNRHGSAAFLQKNEKQNIYLDTMRGSLSGTFTLMFTDAFGQEWTTKPIHINQRLSSKAYVTAHTNTYSEYSASAVVASNKLTFASDPGLAVGTPIVAHKISGTWAASTLVEGVTYYIVSSGTSTSVSATKGGAAISLTNGNGAVGDKFRVYNGGCETCANEGSTTVTFSPSLPYGELVAGDFLMIGDERQEVATVHPEVSTTVHRPIKLGGVIDSVTVRNRFTFAASDAYAFRAGPARGIEAALESLPNGVVPGVSVEDFNTGTLIGYARDGVETKNGVTHANGILGNYDKLSDASAAANRGQTYAKARTSGGLAPYDMVRLTGANGYSEFVQLRNVDLMGVSGNLYGFSGKGAVTTTTSSAIANTGIGAGKEGAIYRAGGYHVRVTFDHNSGDLQEMDVDTSGMYSVFFREFAGTVAATDPSRVECTTHGGDDIQVLSDTSKPTNAHPSIQTRSTGAKYPIPHKSGVNYMTGVADGIPVGSAMFTAQDKFRGAEYDLKVMAGMRVKLADQVRLVVVDIQDETDDQREVAAFYVDAPFVANDASRKVNEVDYIFYRYPVEQLYDEATYNSLSMANTVFINSNMYLLMRAGTGSADSGGGGGYVLQQSFGQTAPDADGTPATVKAYHGINTPHYPGGVTADTAVFGAHQYTGREVGDNVVGAFHPLPWILGNGLKWVISTDPRSTDYCSTHAGLVTDEIVTVGAIEGVGAADSLSEVAAVGGTDPWYATVSTAFYGVNHGSQSAGNDPSTYAPTTMAGNTGQKACVLRNYKPLSAYSDQAAPPLAENGRARWALVTDQRPLRWNNPEIDRHAKSTVNYNVAHAAQRGVLGAGGRALQIALHPTAAANNNKVTTSSSVFTFAFYVAGTQVTDIRPYLGVASGGGNNWYMTVSGCTVDTTYNGEYLISNFAALAITADVASAENKDLDGAGDLGTAGRHRNDYHKGPRVNNKVAAVADEATGICLGDTVTFSTRLPSLIDPKAIAIGDRIKIRDHTLLGRYETRTVDKIWGTKLDVTTFSVIDAFVESDLTLSSSDAWVDESGSTEDITCSRRGLCDGDTGVCQCFAGYTAANCNTQNALAS